MVQLLGTPQLWGRLQVYGVLFTGSRSVDLQPLLEQDRDDPEEPEEEKNCNPQDQHGESRTTDRSNSAADQWEQCTNGQSQPIDNRHYKS